MLHYSLLYLLCNVILTYDYYVLREANFVYITCPLITQEQNRF
jgi:hypothetical protein